jgi:hypothetical protein
VIRWDKVQNLGAGVSWALGFSEIDTEESELANIGNSHTSTFHGAQLCRIPDICLIVREHRTLLTASSAMQPTSRLFPGDAADAGDTLGNNPNDGTEVTPRGRLGQQYAPHHRVFL